MVEVQIVQPGLERYSGADYGGVTFVEGRAIISESEYNKLAGLMGVDIVKEIKPSNSNVFKLNKQIQELEEEVVSLKAEIAALTPQAKEVKEEVAPVTIKKTSIKK